MHASGTQRAINSKRFKVKLNMCTICVQANVPTERSPQHLR